LAWDHGDGNFFLSYSKPAPGPEHISVSGQHSKTKWQFLGQKAKRDEIVSALCLFFRVLYAAPILLAV
jgi:hypothetical protein